MTDRQLYALTIPTSAQTQQSGRAQQQQSIQALLGGDGGVVEALGSDPEEQPLTVEYADRLAEVRAAELRELAQGIGSPVAFYALNRDSAADGYWTVSGVSEAAPVDPRAKEVQRARVQLTREGTPASHWRRVRTGVAQVDHPFGSDATAEVGLDADAAKVRWFDPKTEATAPATATGTRAAQGGAVDIYDADAAPFSNAELLYELPLAEAAVADPRVWDDRDVSKRGGNNELQWQKVFSSQHRYRGRRVLENGLVRVFVDEAASPGIAAEEYDAGAGDWSALSIPQSTGWQVFDWDIRQIGQAQVGGVAEFTDGNTLESVRWQLQRGASGLLFDRDSPFPTGLESLLAPIASAAVLDAYGDTDAEPQGLRPRGDVI